MVELNDNADFTTETSVELKKRQALAGGVNSEEENGRQSANHKAKKANIAKIQGKEATAKRKSRTKDETGMELRQLSIEQFFTRNESRSKKNNGLIEAWRLQYLLKCMEICYRM